jgi:hypothetical protein
MKLLTHPSEIEVFTSLSKMQFFLSFSLYLPLSSFFQPSPFLLGYYIIGRIKQHFLTYRVHGAGPMQEKQQGKKISS